MGIHKSVLYKEVLDALNVRSNGKYIDATFDGGGHSRGILEQSGRVLGLDFDPQALKEAANGFGLTHQEESYRDQKGNLTLTEANFAEIKNAAAKSGFDKVDGVLFDLGLSSDQLEEGKRGFSFQTEGPLDMRLSPSLSVKAEDLINGLNEGELYELFTKYGEEPFSRRISRAIVQNRVKEKISTTRELADLVERTIGRRGKIHPATKIFLALRIAVNDEINNLKKGLVAASEILKPGGRLVVISFHSLEDRAVKDFFSNNEEIKNITKKPIIPSQGEIAENPRSRSAKMRIAEKM